MKFDDVLREVGEFSAYQKRVYFFAAIPTILVAFETLSVLFIFNIPDHRCSVPGYPEDSYHLKDANHSLIVERAIPKSGGHWEQCQVYTDVMITTDNPNVGNGSGHGDVNGSYVAEMAANRKMADCSSWVFDHSIFESTVATDFAVVCARSIARANSNMISEIGTLFGVFACGFLADRFGRKIPFYVGGMALIGGGFGIAFTNNLIALNVCRFVLGIARLTVFLNGFVVGLEIVGPNKRVFTGMFIDVVWCIGEFLLLIFAYFIRQWRYLEIGLSIPSIGLLAYWWLLPESPRWLASQGKKEKAIKILEKIVESNKTKLPALDDNDELFEAETSLTFGHVLASRELRRRMFIIYSNLLVLAMVYYGLTLNVTNLGGNIFVNFLIMVSLEMVGFTVPLFLLDRLGRKPVYCTSMLVAGAACVLSVVPIMLNAPDWVVISLCMTGRLCLCTAYGVIYLYGAELFPTIIRASAMGMGITLSRIGSLISPYIADVGILVGGSLKDALPLIVMGSPALLVGISSLWLTETKDAMLPETLDDLNKLSSAGRCGCMGKGKQDKKEFTVNVEADSLTANGKLERKEFTADGDADANASTTSPLTTATSPV